MKFLYTFGELRQQIAAGFDQQQDLALLLDRALPVVDSIAGPGKILTQAASRSSTSVRPSAAPRSASGAVTRTRSVVCSVIALLLASAYSFAGLLWMIPCLHSASIFRKHGPCPANRTNGPASPIAGAATITVETLTKALSIRRISHAQATIVSAREPAPHLPHQGPGSPCAHPWHRLFSP
ncbi:MAG: hypothetical protein KatS3mg057_2370 [Herpetosiphonaceae bacterium]|nr:MAG: hypothetical protein KatS3mg057_2370 [Herpetosiphonaceae bacterium]